MSPLSAIGNRPIQSSLLPAVAWAGGTAAGARTASAGGNVAARLPVVEPAAASDSVSLSSQALASHVSELGNNTVDLAQRFVNSFAAKLFGDKAAGATLTFDTASLSADASVSASAAHASGQGGTVDTASLSLSESAHFIGTGHIVTADGQTFQFEVEVTYNANLQASSTQASQSAPQSTPRIAAPDALALTGKPLPAIEFPGGLADLFELLGRELRAPAPNNPNGGENGNLSLRLLRLVNSAALLAPRAQPDDPKPDAADRNKTLANPYADAPAASTELATA